MRQLKDLGAPQEVIEHASKRMTPSTFEVFDDCWQSLEVFLALRCQWRVVAGPTGMFYTGLDFGAASTLLTEWGLKKKARKQVWNDLLVMEIEAVAELNKR